MSLINASECLLLQPKHFCLLFAMGIKHRSRTPRTRSVQTRGKGRVKSFERLVLDALMDWEKPTPPRPLSEECNHTFDLDGHDNPPLHPLELIHISLLQSELSKCRLAVAFFNVNLPDDVIETYFYKFRHHGFNFMARPTRIFSYGMEETKFKHMVPLFAAGNMHPVLVTSCEENLSDLISLVKNESKLIMLGGFYCDRLLSANGLEEAAKLNKMDILRGETVAITSSQAINLKFSLQQQQIVLCKQLEKISELKS